MLEEEAVKVSMGADSKGSNFSDAGPPHGKIDETSMLMEELKTLAEVKRCWFRDGPVRRRRCMQAGRGRRERQGN